ncbi:MFS transporter [Siccirubricoccus phaeus]|uniref:MFS transporter n=1 Tax=Siccirubricoccus phaeus TaxID=2595053 RepID=UPI00165AE03A|nr:MFS transporter [Siccirubricoccus phaeus]
MSGGRGPGASPPASLAAALIATTLAQALATFSVFLLPVLAPIMAREIGAEPHWLGWQVALVYLVASSVSLYSAGVLRRFGSARCTQLALAASGLACLAVPLLGLAGAVLGSLLIGFGYGLTNPAATEVLARLSPPNRRNMVFAVKQTGVPLGGALAGALLPSLAQGFGWRQVMLALAALLLTAALGFGWFRRPWAFEQAAGATARGGGGFAVLRQQKGLGGLAVISGCYSGFQLALGAYTVAMLVEEFGWSPVAAGLVASITQALGTVGRVFWGWVADRWRGGMAVLALIGVLTLCGALPLPLATAWPGAAVVALFLLLGGTAAAWNGVAMAEAARLAAPGRAGEATGAVLAVAFAGVVVGPSLIGALVSAVGSYALSFGLLALLPAAGMLVAWRLARR